ncbi:hypothetical protein FJT64_016175 [Amphibalanus amphitrite]|uniref:Uncharacterized protein n=1 Tax=Amphibalanus amphitrite TaxID=1232801 RepID=A0A6A4X1Z7_AMPAM|nr:hypothetical protein FJT64_016175 [Amphibalanus amphitrite]
MALLVPLLAALVSGGSALLAAGRWRTNLTLSVVPLAERPSPSPTHCVALCAGWPSPCAAVTLVSGSCRLHEQGVCDDPDILSLVPLAGARYYDLYNHTWELLKEGGADCETLGLCGWRCYCSVDCPQAGMYPKQVYTCDGTECTLNSDYWQASATLALPLWAEEIATDGQLAIKKTFSVGDRLVFRFEVKVSQLAEIKTTIRGIAGEVAHLIVGVNNNNGVRVELDMFLLKITETVTLPSILSTSKYRRLSLVFQPGGGYDITGEDETVPLYSIPFFQATYLASVEFSSPPGVSAFWRMEAGLADQSLLSETGTDLYPTVKVGSEGIFLRIAPVTSYEFKFHVTAPDQLWVEFRQEYQFQDDKALRLSIQVPDRNVLFFPPYGIAVGVASGSEFTQDDFQVPTVAPISALAETELTVSWTGDTVTLTSADISVSLRASVALTEIRYVGVGCDSWLGATVRMTAGEPGWSTEGWKEGGRGYSTGNNLL